MGSEKEKLIEVIWHYEIKMILDLRKKSFFLVVPLYSGSHKQHQRQFPLLLLCPYTTCVLLPHQSVAVIAFPSSESWNTKLLIVFLLAWMLGIENSIGPTSSSSNPLLA